MDVKAEYKELADRVDRFLERSASMPQAASGGGAKEVDNLESC